MYPLVAFMHFALTRMPGKSYRGRFWSFLVCSCDVRRALFNSLTDELALDAALFNSLTVEFALSGTEP